MEVFRVYRKRHRSLAFSGEGARGDGARWNLPGTAVVYTSATLSLCLLEFFVHLDPGIVDINVLELECRSAEIPDILPILEVKEPDLPRHWNAVPWQKGTQIAGTRWIEEGQYPVISVPSAIVPSERNFLLNPMHPAFSQIIMRPPSRFPMDPRMFKARQSPH